MQTKEQNKTIGPKINPYHQDLDLDDEDPNELNLKKKDWKIQKEWPVDDPTQRWWCQDDRQYQE